MPVAPYRLARHQLAGLDSSARLILLHPDFSAQSLVLDALLAEPGAVYVPLRGPDVTAATALATIEAAAAEAGVTLDAVSTLAIDEADRVPQAEGAALWPELVLQRTRGRVVLLTRATPHVALDHPALRAVTRFVPVDEALMLTDYATRGNGDTLLEVYAFGPGRVRLNGKPVESWDGVLPRSLFLYLVDRGMTTRQDIFATFWPNLTPKEATNVFHVTKRKISEVLGLDLTVYWSGFYHIAPGISLRYDASVFTGLVQDSTVVADPELIGLLRGAVALYRSDYLDGLEMAWARKRRDELRQTYSEALVALARALERQGATKEALGLFLRAGAINRQREDLALTIMRLFHELRMPEDALRVYEHLEEELHSQLKLAPAPSVQQLARTIRDELHGAS